MSATRHHLLCSLLLLGAIPTLCPTAKAQALLQPDHVLGGFTNAVWMQRLPLLGGQPGAFRVWTAEDGSRIQMFDSTTGSLTENQVQPSTGSPQTLHDIYLDHFQDLVGEQVLGMAVGTGGEALCTMSPHIDRWQPFPTPPAAGMELWACAVEHVSQTQTTVWAAGEGPTLVCSGDRGQNWHNSILTPAVASNCVFTALDFADWSLPLRRGVVGNNMGQIYYTDNGMTWQEARIDGKPVPNSPLVFWDIDWVPGSNTHAFAVGGRQEGNGDGFAWRTTDGGRTWQRVLTMFEKYKRAEVPVISYAPGHSCEGTTGTVPLGQNLHLNYDTLYGCHAMQNGEAWFVAYGGQVWKYDPLLDATCDESDTARFATSPLWGIHGDGANEMFLSGQFGNLRRSTNGGGTWSEITMDNVWRLQDLVFFSDQVGYVVGQSRRIAKTTDAGATWEEQLAYYAAPIMGQSLNAIAGFDQNRLVAVGHHYNGSNPVAFFTENGGASCWGGSQLPPTVGIHAMRDVAAAGVNPANGKANFFVCGDAGASWSGLMRSTDGGATFRQVPLGGVLASWRSIATIGSNVVLLVGEGPQAGSAAARITFDAQSVSPTWHDVTPSVASGPLDGVAANGAAAIAVGEGGAVYEFDPISRRLVQIGTAGGDLSAVSMTNYAGNVVAVAVGKGGAYWLGSPGAGVFPGTGAWRRGFSRTTDDLSGLSVLNVGGGLNVWMTGKNSRWGDSTVLNLR